MIPGSMTCNMLFVAVSKGDAGINFHPLRWSLLYYIINDTPELVLEIIVTHSLRGFAYYLKMYLLQKYQNVCTISDCYICQFNTQSLEF